MAGNKRGERQCVVMTGSAGRLAQLLAKRLHRTGAYDIVGIDRRPMRGLPKDIEHLRVDLRSKRAREVFRTGRVSVLIHMGLMRNLRVGGEEQSTFNVVGTARLLEYCLEYNVPKVIVMSSNFVYGTRPGNQQYIAEDAPLMGAVDFPAYRDLIEVDMQATSFFWRSVGTHIETVVLRPVHILGSVRNDASKYLRLPCIPVVMGFDPMVQVIHELDVVEAVVDALEPGIHGIFNITGPAEVPLSVLVKETGKPVVAVPGTLFRLGLKAAWRMRLSSFPAPELAAIQYVGMVDGSRARELMNFRPRHSLREAVRAALAGQSKI